MAELSGQKLGQYRLGEMIGRGGMAGVYRARQESMDRDVAIKVMATELSRNEEFVARFEREARVIAQLQHPHILPVIDFGREGSLIYLVMRLVEGGILSDRLQQTTLTLQQVDAFLGQIASALEYAHQRGVVHRDLKPNNILLDDMDNVYLTDFGIAKMLAGTTSQISLTATGSVMGTPAYMAPEQWRSEPVDARTDIYALGIILYEMLMGTPPFRAETPFGMMYKHFDALPPPPRAINPSLPEGIEAIALRAMAKQPEDRFPSARQMAAEFKQIVAALPPEETMRKLPRATAEQIERATPPAGQRAAPPPPTGPMGPTVATAYGDADPTPPSPAEVSQVLPTVAHETVRHRSGRGWLVGGIAVALVAVAAAIAALLMGGQGKDERSGEQTAAAIAALATHTPTAASLIIITPSEPPPTAIDVIDTPAPDHTPAAMPTQRGNTGQQTPSVATTTAPTTAHPPSATWTVTATATASPTLTTTPTATLTPTASPTPTVTHTPTLTPDLDATAGALLALRLTQTATHWTDTPTPDIEASVIAALTGTAAAWTDTPTHTPTRTPSATPRPTRTPLPTLPPPTRTRPPTRTPRLRVSPTRTLPPQCNGMPFRMEVGEGGRTTLLPPLPTNVRRDPDVNAMSIRQIPPGQTFEVIGGPECASGIAWWEIKIYDRHGLWTGWIGEGQNGSYWIEPFESGSASCPGALPPRLVVGETGRITFSPPVPSNVRSIPRKRPNNIIGKLQPGQQFSVVSGPVCDEENKWRWWLVRTQTLEGWVAEGKPGEYWMEPWP